jgi:acetylornithine deacetylase/succinyl-diaminopimelate desuccinylase-like protein
MLKRSFELSGVITKVPKELSFIKKVKTVKYFTELSYYKKGVVFGPGDIKFAHSEKEMIEKSDLRKAVKIYKRIIENYNL